VHLADYVCGLLRAWGFAASGTQDGHSAGQQSAITSRVRLFPPTVALHAVVRRCPILLLLVFVECSRLSAGMSLLCAIKRTYIQLIRPSNDVTL